MDTATLGDAADALGLRNPKIEQTQELFESIRIAPPLGNSNVSSPSFALYDTETEEYWTLLHDTLSSSNLRLAEVEVKYAKVRPDSFIMLIADDGENDTETETLEVFATVEERATDMPVAGAVNVPGNVPVELTATTLPEESTKAASTESLKGTALSGSLKVPNEKVSILFATTLPVNINSISETVALDFKFQKEIMFAD
jgi:hypothetical protein